MNSRPPHFTLYTLLFTLYTLHSTLYTLHSTLYTLESRPQHSTWTLYHHTLHSTLYTFHSTPYMDSRTPHSPLYTLHYPPRNHAGVNNTGKIRPNIKFLAFWCVFLKKIKVDPERW